MCAVILGVGETGWPSCRWCAWGDRLPLGTGAELGGWVAVASGSVGFLSAGDTFSFKYSPGKLRGNQYKKMMTREELEEEQR